MRQGIPAIQYKVVEISTVTDEVIEQVINEWISKGWGFDQIQFVVRDASRRPSMAFIFFVRPESDNHPGASFEKMVFHHPDDPPAPDDSSNDEEIEICG